MNELFGNICTRRYYLETITRKLICFGLPCSFLAVFWLCVVLKTRSETLLYLPNFLAET